MQLKAWKVLCWNVRGINSDKKLLALCNAISSSGCSVICLQETKRATFDLAFVKLFCPKKFDKFEVVPSQGASGGLIVLWDSSVFPGCVFCSEVFALGIQLTSVHTGKSWKIVNIYGPCAGQGRSDFTSWLFDLDIPDVEDWLFCGDFNYIRAPDNRNKPGGDANDMLTFNDFIHAQALVELPIKGRQYTWSNMQSDPLLEQIDWFFTSSNWTSNYPNTIVGPLPKPVSDHTPCVISIESSVPKSRIFRFENF